MGNNNLLHKKFAEIDLKDVFFDSLREDYEGFDRWFQGKSEQDAYVQYDNTGKVTGFLYLKIEKEAVPDVKPILIAKKILKVGTFKINAHGTKMGEQFIKVIMDYALNEAVDVCYVTTFSKQEKLINLITQFGFIEYGIKANGKRREKVFVKDMRKLTGDICLDFPKVNFANKRKYMLSIYPKYHSVMFPDSILTTENKDIITDISYTNSIHKIYVCSMLGVEKLRNGDIVVLYRTADGEKSAEYSSVATSICVVEEVKLQSDFNNFEEFYKYSCQYSVFEQADLWYWYKRGGLKAIKLTYNAALKKRIVRHDLIEKLGLRREVYWGFFELSNQEFMSIVKAGEVSDSIILNKQMF